MSSEDKQAEPPELTTQDKQVAFGCLGTVLAFGVAAVIYVTTKPKPATITTTIPHKWETTVIDQDILMVDGLVLPTGHARTKYNIITNEGNTYEVNKSTYDRIGKDETWTLTFDKEGKVKEISKPQTKTWAAKATDNNQNNQIKR